MNLQALVNVCSFWSRPLFLTRLLVFFLLSRVACRFAFAPHPEYQKQKALEDKQAAGVSGRSSVLADEARHKREQQERARAKQEKERQALFGSMSREKVMEMKHQATLRAQMQMAHKTGDMATYRRLQERLEADEK